MSHTVGQHGCRANCGLCHPHKRWKDRLSRVTKMRFGDRRRAMDDNGRIDGKRPTGG